MVKLKSHDKAFSCFFFFFPFLKHNLGLKLKVMFKKTYDDKNICIISDLPNASMKSPGLRDAR